MARILIIDDYFEFAAWIENILHQQGYQSDVCTSGNLAKDKLRTEIYDLVITDIIMPEPDGIELCKYIREGLEEDKRQVPIIAISGGAASIDARVALSAVGRYASMVMQKPFPPQNLIKAVRHLLQFGEQNFMA